MDDHSKPAWSPAFLRGTTTAERERGTLDRWIYLTLRLSTLVFLLIAVALLVSSL